jgi:hypothetical protein
VKLPSTKENPALVIAFVRRAVTICICLALALVVAYWIGTGQTGYLKIAAGLTIVALVSAGLRQRAWMLIPIAWTLNSSCLLIPLHFSFRDVAILLAVCAYISYRVLTHEDMRRPTHLLDCLLVLIVINTIIDFARHPAGLLVFGSVTIGGRGYINIALAVLAYWVIVRLPDSMKPVSWIPYLVLAGPFFVAVLNIIVRIAPSTTPFLYMFYGGVDYSGYVVSPLAEPEVTRFMGLRDLGYTLVLVLCALYPPKTIFNPARVRFYLLILGFLLVLISGFRSTLLAIVAAMAISAVLYQGWRGFLITSLAGGLILATVTFGQGRLYELPSGVQRAFSFLPGRWSAVVLKDAENSSQSRFDWWRRIIQEDVIKDWAFGDGMGMAEKDFESLSSQTTFFEWFTITGGFHNGPLTTIRFAGIIGLVLIYTYSISAAIYAVKCVRLCRGTSLEPAAVFLAMQLIWFPVDFTFVFGAYDLELPNQIFLVALLMLLMRMAPQARAAAAAAVPRAAQPMTPTPAMA